MKHSVFFSLLLGILCFVTAYAQPPQKMTYQAVVRDAQNNLIVNQQIGIRISIIRSSLNGTPDYIETHSAITNHNGLFTISVGDGLPNPGSRMQDIDWSSDDFYIQSEIDLNGGTNYTLTGGQQLVSVPYAFYCGTADYNQLINRPPSGTNPGDILYWNGSSWNLVPAGSEGQFLTMGNNNTPTWTSPGGNLGSMPIITTDSVFNITGRNATVHATIVNPGSTGIISSGICWSTTPYPSIGNAHTTDGTSIGVFLSTASNLTSGTTFYVRAYATNAGGTAYGIPISFTTPTHCGTMTDYDGNVYNTVYIGAQCWMKENLKTTHYSNGAAIPEGNNSQYNDKYYFKYNRDAANEAKYGLLYTWQATMNGAGSSDNNPSGIQGICPSGWHVPSNSEWCELENYIEPGIDVNCNTTGYRGSMAKKLSAPREWTSYPQNYFAPGQWQTDTAGFDISGFSTLPGGYYQGNSSPYYYELNDQAHFWTCTRDPNNTSYIFYRYLGYNQSGVGRSTSYYQEYAYSVRCVKN